jgi:translation initiation factor IF-3
MEHARQWLEEGDKVRAAIAFRGREMSHRELGAKILRRLTEELADLGDVEVAPKMEGYQMFTIFNPKKVKPEVKKAAPKKADEPAPEKKKEPKKEAAKETAPAAAPKEDDEIF